MKYELLQEKRIQQIKNHLWHLVIEDLEEIIEFANHIINIYNEDLEEEIWAGEKEGLTPEQVKNALDPLLSFRGQLEDEVTTYEKIKRGNIGAIENFYGIGRSLIAMRISVGITQTELAKKLGMESSNFCRLEKNEFHGAKPELINRVLQALGFRARTTFERVA